MHTSELGKFFRPALVQSFKSFQLPSRALLVKAAFGICIVQGATAIAQVSVSPAALNWVSVPVGGKGAQKVVTLTNSGAAAITIGSITFTGANPGDFLIFSKTCGTSLAASANCTANIIFGPTATGARSATLNFNDSASNTPQKVALTGQGTAAGGSVSASPSSLTFASTFGWLNQRIPIGNLVKQADILHHHQQRRDLRHQRCGLPYLQQDLRHQPRSIGHLLSSDCVQANRSRQSHRES